MSYDEFNEMVRTKLEDICGEEFSVSVYEALKNNSVVHKGISIKENTNQIAPTIYMDEYYTDYCDGRDISEIIHDILRVYSANRLGPEVDTEKFTDFEWVKDRIFFKVINAEKNRGLLQQVPCSLYLDLAMVYGVYMGDYKGSFSSILIKKEHMKLWQVDSQEIRELAVKNTPGLLPSGIWTMSDLLMDMGAPADCGDFGIPMYILSNKNRVNGAGAMLYEGVLRRFAEDIDSDLYVLPSSVHELILVPQGEIRDPMELKELIAEVNDTQVAGEEILSYSLYEYRRDRDRVDIVFSGDMKKAASA